MRRPADGLSFHGKSWTRTFFTDKNFNSFRRRDKEEKFVVFCGDGCFKRQRGLENRTPSRFFAFLRLLTSSFEPTKIPSFRLSPLVFILSTYDFDRSSKRRINRKLDKGNDRANSASIGQRALPYRRFKRDFLRIVVSIVNFREIHGAPIRENPNAFSAVVEAFNFDSLKFHMFSSFQIQRYVFKRRRINVLTLGITVSKG